MVSNVSTSDVNIRSLRHRLRRLLYNAIEQGYRRQGLEFDHRLHEECEREMEQHVSKEGTYNDVYDDERSYKDAIYRDICVLKLSKLARVSHFLGFSVDAIWPIFRDLLGKLYLHHPLNLGIIAHCLNLLEGRDIPQILVLSKAARKQWLKEQDGTAGDVDFWH